MTDEQTKQAILGFTEFFKGITGNQDLEIPSDIAEKLGIEKQEPSGDAVSRQEILSKINEVCFSEKWKGFRIDYGSNGQRDFLIDYIKQMLPVNPQEPKTGHCEDCKHFRKLPYHADTLGKCIHHTGFCPKGDWYCADFEPQERSE